LVAKFKHFYDEDLVLLLRELGVEPVLMDEQPPAPKEYSDPIYDELVIDGKPTWLKRVGYCKILDEWFYVSYGMEGLRILANGGSYEVELSDVIKAKKLESKMNFPFFLRRVDNS
jgi:hypothetical protein